MSTFLQLQNDVLNFFGLKDAEARTEVRNAINNTIWEINSEVPRSIHLEKTGSFTLTSGTIAVTGGIPSDLDHILSVSLIVNGQNQPPLEWLSRRAWQENRLFDLGNTEPSNYTVWDNILYVGPPPDSNYSGTLEYYSYDAKLSADTDTCNLTDHFPRWERVIIAGSKAAIQDYLGSDQQLIDKFEAKYQLAMTRFRAWINRNIDKSPNATRVRGWKEKQHLTTPLIASQFRRD